MNNTPFDYSEQKRTLKWDRQQNCPICSGPGIDYTLKDSCNLKWIIRKCTFCGHGFVRDRPPLDFLNKYYRSTDNAHAHTLTSPSPETASKGWLNAVVNLRQNGAPHNGFTLDVGAGYGGLGYALSEAGYMPILIDLSPEIVSVASGIPNATGCCCSFEDFRWHSPLNIITMSQVLEHAINPTAWLQHARSLISSDGLLLVAVPNFGGVYSLLGKHDPFLCPPEHLNFFTVKSLKALLKASGFCPIKLVTESRVAVRHATKRFSLKRFVLGHAWNFFSSILDPTPFGIITVVYCRPV